MPEPGHWPGFRQQRGSRNRCIINGFAVHRRFIRKRLASACVQAVTRSCTPWSLPFEKGFVVNRASVLISIAVALLVSSGAAQAQTLKKVIDRGALICGVT